MTFLRKACTILSLVCIGNLAYAQKGEISGTLLDEVTDLTTSTAKFLLKRQEQGIEEEPEIPQVLYSKYLESK